MQAACYDIDRRAEGELARLDLRRTEWPPVLDELTAWLRNQTTLTSLSIGKAAAYAHGSPS